jgi:hypothetical protein
MKLVSRIALSPRIKLAFRDPRCKPPSETSHTEDELLEEVVDVSDVEEEDEAEAEVEVEVEVVVELEAVVADVEAVLCTTVLVTLLVTSRCSTESPRRISLHWLPQENNSTRVFGQRRGST